MYLTSRQDEIAQYRASKLAFFTASMLTIKEVG